MAKSRQELVLGLDRISSGLEFIKASLSLLDQPVSLGDDHFVAFDNVEAGVVRLYDSFRLDLMLPMSSFLSRYYVQTRAQPYSCYVRLNHFYLDEKYAF